MRGGVGGWWPRGRERKDGDEGARVRRLRGDKGGFGEGRTGAWGCRRPVHYATTRLHVPPRAHHSLPLHFIPPATPPFAPLSPASHPPEQRATVLRCSRRTGAKYNREAPRLMSRPNKEKNRPLNNARCNVGAAARREMHGKGRNAFFEISRVACVASLSPSPSTFLCSHRFFYPPFPPSNPKSDGSDTLRGKCARKNLEKLIAGDNAPIVERSIRTKARKSQCVAIGVWQSHLIPLLIFGIFNAPQPRTIYPGERCNRDRKRQDI